MLARRISWRQTLLLIWVPLLAIMLSGCQQVEEKTVTESQPIPFNTIEQEDASRPQGERTVQTPGKDGVLEVTYRQRWVDGEIESQERVSERVRTQPVDEIVIVGTSAGHVVFVQPNEGGDIEFHVANADGSNSRLVATFSNYDGSHIRPLEGTFDSYHIAWAQPYIALKDYETRTTSLRLINALTGQALDVVPKGELRIVDYEFSPDCTKLYYILRTGAAGDRGTEAHLYVFDIASRKSTRLADDIGGINIILSPDGSKIALASSKTGFGRPFTFVMDADGGNQKLIQNLPGTAAFFGNDGATLYLDGGETVVDVAADNTLSNQRESFFGDNIPTPLYAGTLFVSRAKSYRLTGSHFEAVSDFSAASPRPADFRKRYGLQFVGFRADGRAAAYISSAEGNAEVYVVDPSGLTTRVTNDFVHQFDARLWAW